MARRTGPLNLITDVAGVRVGHADDARAATGVSVVVFDPAAVASISMLGGAPGVRDTACLEPDMTVEETHAIALAGGSAFGLDAAGGVQAVLAAQGRGLAVGAARVPLVPQAIVFDLNNGGDKAWGMKPPFFELGARACAAAAAGVFGLGTIGAGYGATTATLKGGLGSASMVTSRGVTVGVLAVVNAVGAVTIGRGPHFWAAPYEIGAEFGGCGWPASLSAEGLALRMKGGAPPSTTIACVATDAALTKAQARRIAIMAHDGLARAIRPAHAPMDGDTVFAAATGQRTLANPMVELTEIGLAGADCLARAIARGVHAATALPFPGALPSWADLWGAGPR